jgi:hypothetical protein
MREVRVGTKFLGAFYGLAPFANDPGWDYSAPITQGNSDASYVLVARSGSGEPATYVSLIVSQGWHRYPVYKLDVVETRGQTGGIFSRTGAGKEAEDEPPKIGSGPRAGRRSSGSRWPAIHPWVCCCVRTGSKSAPSSRR